MIYLIESEYANSFMEDNTIVHSDIPDTDKAYMQVYKTLEQDINNATGNEIIKGEYTPPIPTVDINILVDNRVKELEEEVVFNVSAIAKDQYGNKYDVNWSDNVVDNKVLANEIGEITISAESNGITQELVLHVIEKVEPIEEPKLEDYLFDHEERIAMLEMGGI